MKRLILILLPLAAIAVWFLLDARRGADEPAPISDSPEPRVLDPGEVVEYAEMEALTYRVRTARDVWPGGLAAAMAPVLVVWDESEVSAGGSITIRNVNHGGNPVAGVTEFRTAEIRPDRVARVEYVLVPLGGREMVSHGQLRFVFEDGGARFLGPDSEAVGEPDLLEDLVLSWEAWRAPGEGYSIKEGMDRGTYELTLRAYSGVQRFLEDALMQRDWTVYTLQLPGGAAGCAELLRVSLAMGDGAARDVMARALERASTEWAGTGPDSDREGGDSAAQWREIGSRLGRTPDPGDSRVDLSGRTGYQSVLRSCATMALYAVDVTTARLIEQGHPHEGMRPTQSPMIPDEPEWMNELARADMAGLFLRAPRAVWWVLRNPTAIPGRIPGALDEAGLVVRRDGEARVQHFRIGGETPWGPSASLLIR